MPAGRWRFASLVVVAVALAGCTWGGVDSPSTRSLGSITPVMLLHGKPISEPGAPPASTYDKWDAVRESWREWGLAESVTWAYHAGDKGADHDVHDHPASLPDNGHGSHYGGPSAHAHAGRHGGDASIRHLGYHWAWAVHDLYSANGTCVNVVAHSMGGLVVRYAVGAYAQRAESEFADFPPSLCVTSVATIGTPHEGTVVTNACAPTDVECEEVKGGSAFMAALRGDPEFLRPQADGGTAWLVIGSDAENVVVPAGSTYGMDFDRAIVHESEDRILHSEERIENTPAGTLVIPARWYFTEAGDDAGAHVRAKARGEATWASSASAEWPARQVFRFFSES